MKISKLAAACLLALASQAQAEVLISQIYGGGGNSGAPLRNDFIELFNAGTTPVALDGWSVQYASAMGTSWQLTPLKGTLAPGQYLLVQQAAGANQNAAALPSADVIGAIPMAASAGKVALVRNTTALSCESSCAGRSEVADLVAYGNANDGFGAPAAALNNSNAALRQQGGCRNTRNALADFAVQAPAPRTSASPLNLCGDAAPTPSPTPTPTPTPDPVAGNVRIHHIQGHSHRSPLDGQVVSNVPGVVTLVLSNGFYFQDEQGDNDPLTSEGVFVFTSSRPTVAAGDRVLVSGRVSEFRPGGSGGTTNLSVTQIGSKPQVTIVARQQALPAALRLDQQMPRQVFWSGPAGDIEQAPRLQLSNGLDLYESIEGMRVQLDNPVATGPTNSYDEVPLLANAGIYADLRTARGGIVVRADDFNPERLILDAGSVVPPKVNVGDGFTQVSGVLDYNFGNYKLLATEIGQRIDSGLQAETTRAQQRDELAVASFNVENLSAKDSEDKFRRLAQQIVGNLQQPDILGLMEVQDNNGATNDQVVAADQTLLRLIAAIRAAGGPEYQYRQIDPVDDRDGGQPGGNIRLAFLFNPARVSFVDRAGGSSTSAVTLAQCGPRACLSASPARLDPQNPAFEASRKPLAGEFIFNGRRLIVIANHWNSKGGDQPLSGRFQPPQRSSEVQRQQQAEIVADFTRRLLAQDPAARLVILGDLNDFQFSAAVNTLKAVGMHDLVENLPESERYTYVFEGNSQALDHIMVSPALAPYSDYDVVHINSEFYEQTSDHDPEVARLAFAPAQLGCYPQWQSQQAYAGAVRVSVGEVTYESRWWNQNESPLQASNAPVWQNLGACSPEIDPPAQPVLTPSVEVRIWNSSASYQRGDRVSHLGKVWISRMAHTAQAAWSPEQAPSLWLLQ